MDTLRQMHLEEQELPSTSSIILVMTVYDCGYLPNNHDQNTMISFAYMSQEQIQFLFIWPSMDMQFKLPVDC